MKRLDSRNLSATKRAVGVMVRMLVVGALPGFVGCNFVHPYSDPGGPCDDLEVGDIVRARIVGYENPELLERPPWECEKNYGVEPGLVIEARIEEVGYSSARDGCRERLVSIADFGKIELLENLTPADSSGATVSVEYSYRVLETGCAGTLGMNIFLEADSEADTVFLGFEGCPSQCLSTYTAEVTTERAASR